MNLERIIDNRTPTAARCFTLDAPDGREQLVTVVKLTCAMRPEGMIPSRRQRPVRSGARLSNGPGSSERLPSDMVLYKPGTDVLLVGTAHPPSENATEVEVSLRVLDGERLCVDKTLKVFGPRVWQKGAIRTVPGPPARLRPTPLTWENTYGGMDRSGERTVMDPQNPVGSGVAEPEAKLIGTAAPCIEPQRSPWSGRPVPACFAPVSAHWEPRARRFGTCDASWRAERAPIPPLDFDPRFASSAPDDQWCERPLSGGELVEVRGATPAGVWRFEVPQMQPTVVSCVEDVEATHRPHLDTLLIDADEQCVELCWRTALPMPRKSEALRWVRVFGADTLAEDIRQAMVRGLEDT